MEHRDAIDVLSSPRVFLNTSGEIFKNKVVDGVLVTEQSDGKYYASYSKIFGAPFNTRPIVFHATEDTLNFAVNEVLNKVTDAVNVYVNNLHKDLNSHGKNNAWRPYPYEVEKDEV